MGGFRLHADGLPAKAQDWSAAKAATNDSDLRVIRDHN